MEEHLVLMETGSHGNGSLQKEVLCPVYLIPRIGHICVRKQFLKEISKYIFHRIIQTILII